MVVITKLKISKIFISLFIGTLSILLIIYFNMVHSPNREVESGNCRFWGIIFSDLDSSLQNLIRVQLDSLQALGDSHQDGWGMGYFISPDSDVILPIVSRGEPRAPFDPRYDKVVDNMVNYIKKSAVAHIRSGSSGPTSGIPDPHPFLRYGIHREFQMLFAHHGKIPGDVLLDLINSINPVYLDSNPPDYEPEYLDSDIYSIYMMEIFDTYAEWSIEECIKLAIIKLDSALGIREAECNFVMSNGSSLWALRFVKASTGGYNLHFYPNSEISNYWIVASEPLDTIQSYWIAVPNSTLVVLNPGQPPELSNIFEKADRPNNKIEQGLGLIYPNPFKENVTIRYGLLDTAEINMKIYDAKGSLVRILLTGTKNPGHNTIAWDGKDDHGNDLPNGTYFCKLVIGNVNYKSKIVVVK